MTEEASPAWNARKSAVVVTLLAALICFHLLVTSHTPRGRFNVTQFVSVAFFLVVIVRHWTTAAVPAVESADSRGRRSGLILAMVVAAGVWSFMLPSGFVSDDFALLYGARQPGLAGLWHFMDVQGGLFLRPVGFASIFLDYRLWQQWAPGYHLTNLVIHLAAIAAFYFLCEYLRLGTEAATTASLIYAVLPVHAEAVTWMGCRFDLLSECLVIVAAVLYLKFRKSGSRVTCFGALVCFVLAALSKETAFVFPVLLFLVEYLIMPDRRYRHLPGFFLVAAALFGLRWWALGGIGGYMDSSGEAATFNIGFKTLEGPVHSRPGRDAARLQLAAAPAHGR